MTDRIPLEKFILAAVVKRFETLFQKETRIVSRYHKEHWWRFNRDQQPERPNKAIFLELVSLSFTETNESYAGRKLARPRNIVDVTTKRMLNGELAPSDVTINSIIPTDFTFRVVFIVEGYDNVLEVWNTWSLLSINHALTFSIDYGEQMFEIRADLDNQFDFPELPHHAEKSDAYEIVANLVIHGYTTVNQPNTKLIHEVKTVNFDLNGV